MVWIRVGSNTPVSFNAIQDNGLNIYPATVYVYSSGAWKNVHATIYKDGVWKDLQSYIYYYGDEFNGITGGWTAIGTATFTKGATSISLARSITNTSTNTFATVVNGIDLTPYTAVKFHIDTFTTSYLNSRGFGYVGIAPNNTSMTAYAGNFLQKATLTTIAAGTGADITVDCAAINMIAYPAIAITQYAATETVTTNLIVNSIELIS